MEGASTADQLERLASGIDLLLRPTDCPQTGASPERAAE